MAFSKIFFAVVSIIPLLSGCEVLRFQSGYDDDASQKFFQQSTESTKISHFSMPEQSTSSVYQRQYFDDNGQGDGFETPGSSVDLFPASISGVWNLSVGGKLCRIATPQTKFSRGYRAAPLQCPRAFANVNSWAVKGKKLYFYDKSDRVVAALDSVNRDKFRGYTSDNQQVVLSR